MTPEEEDKFMEINMKHLISFAKMYKSYLWHKRNKWTYYIPFYQIKYDWIMNLWSMCYTDIKNTIELCEIVKGEKPITAKPIEKA